jgi:hypothetical protein
MRRTRSMRITRSNGLALSQAKRTRKKRPTNEHSIGEIEVNVKEIDGHTIETIQNGNNTRFEVNVIDGLFSSLPNTYQGLTSFYTAFSQILYGNTEKHVQIEKVVCDFISHNFPDTTKTDKTKYHKFFRGIQNDEKCHRAVIDAYILAASKLYNIYLLVFYFNPNENSYRLKRFGIKKKDAYFLKYDEESLQCKAMIEKVRDRRQDVENDQEEGNDHGTVKEILEHLPFSFQNLQNVDFHVKWEEGGHTHWLPWNELLSNTKMHSYLKKLEKKVPRPAYLKKAIDAVNKYKQTRGNHSRPAVVQPNHYRRKKNTGKKLSVIGDILELKGKGGVYSIMPYEQLDDKNKGIFKIGMTTDFSKRMEQMHGYYPDGVYFISLLSDPKIPEWTDDKIQRWKKTHKGKLPTNDEKKADFYRTIERFLFKYMDAHKAKRIHSTTRVKKQNDDKKGETEWFYTTEDLIHDAFQAAHDKYSNGEGRLQQFYLSGFDPDTGEEVESINVLAKRRENEAPNFVGKVIYKL